MKIRFWFWLPFGSHFGGVLGAQMEAKAIKKPLQKSIKKMMLKMSPNWSQREPQMASPGDPPTPYSELRGPPGSHQGALLKDSPEELYSKTCKSPLNSCKSLPNSIQKHAKNDPNQSKISLRYYLVFWTWFSCQQLQSGIRE